MARLWSSGIELQSVTAAVEFDAVVNSPTINTTIKRSGAASLRCNVSSTTAYISHAYRPTDSTPAFARMYVRFTSFPAGLTTIGYFFDSLAGGGTNIRVNSNGTLEFWNETLAQVGSDSPALSVDTWYRIEWSHEAGAGPPGAR